RALANVTPARCHLPGKVRDELSGAADCLSRKRKLAGQFWASLTMPFPKIERATPGALGHLCRCCDRRSGGSAPSESALPVAVVNIRLQAVHHHLAEEEDSRTRRGSTISVPKDRPLAPS